VRRLVPVLLLVVASCGPIWGNEDEKGEALDQATVRSVVGNLLASITRKHEEIGPLFASHLQDMKDAAAVREGFKDWAEFKLGLKATDPRLEVEVANRITAHMNSLLTPADEEHE
jgi:hypothetical protein